MNTNYSLAHFAPISLDSGLGMGRVAVHWRDAFIRRGWIYNHYGSKEVPMPMIKPLWANSAKRSWNKSGKHADLLLAHEPSAEVFRQTQIPTVLFSHGLEERGAELSPSETDKAYQSWKSIISKPFWDRLAYQRFLALSKCPLLLLLNQDDKSYAINRYSRQPEDIFVYRNGVNPSVLQSHDECSSIPTVLFYGSWLERKGIAILIKAAIKLAQSGIKPRWLLVGTGKSKHEVLSHWPVELRDKVSVKPTVSAGNDDSIYEQATIFVLPSFYEGQPLTLLQAMESGRCVITTNCCGQKDIVKNGFNGFLFEPGNTDQFAKLIAETLASKDIRAKIGSQAKLDMASRRWPEVAEEVVDRLDIFMKTPRL